MKKNVLFTTTVFSVDEKDGLTSYQSEKSFVTALEQMVRFGGMYVWSDRKFEYLSNKRILVDNEKASRIVFGTIYSYPEAIMIFDRSCLYFIREDEEENQQAKCVYNARAKRIIPVCNNDIILSEDVLACFLSKNHSSVVTKKRTVVFTDFCFKQRVDSRMKQASLKECFQSQMKEMLINREIDYIRANKIKFFNDGTSVVDEMAPIYLFRQNAWVSSDWARLHFFNNPRMIMFMRQHPDDRYLYDASSDQLQTVPERAFFVSDSLLRKWIAG